ncbi:MULTISPECIES: hypothetical protein [Streptomyces violaceusniger group]|uniref:Uncharacterized protein n=1 Tax=Streptomyces javensis TaxID=114698 RepID=A0ABS0R574_9ACTN|nr:hypothetical protein [Streptomyces javensis]MBI0311887.1 hypothetical protein [Streptomyces javensis]
MSTHTVCFPAGTGTRRTVGLPFCMTMSRRRSSALPRSRVSGRSPTQPKPRSSVWSSSSDSLVYPVSSGLDGGSASKAEATSSGCGVVTTDTDRPRSISSSPLVSRISTVANPGVDTGVAVTVSSRSAPAATVTVRSVPDQPSGVTSRAVMSRSVAPVLRTSTSTGGNPGRCAAGGAVAQP